MSLEGQQLGRYRFQQRLGGGGMGEVYLANDTVINRQVAVKIIRTEMNVHLEAGKTESAARLFQREMKAISQLDHPNILPLFDYGEEVLGNTTTAYLVMPYRPEGSLSQWITSRGGTGSLTTQDVVHVIFQAAQALQHAHDHHIIHQDVKPANFLMRNNAQNPGRPDLFLADFGVAKLSSATSNTSQAIRGTPSYMAPEQWEGNPVPATDQYALGVMTYELLMGQALFQGSPSQMMFKHLTVTPQPPSALNPQLPKALDPVLLRALAKTPEQRFPNINEFAQDLQNALRGIDVPTTVISAQRAQNVTPQSNPTVRETPNHPPASPRTPSETNIETIHSKRPSQPVPVPIPLPQNSKPGATNTPGIPPTRPAPTPSSNPNLYNVQPPTNIQPSSRQKPLHLYSSEAVNDPNTSRTRYQQSVPQYTPRRSSTATTVFITLLVILLVAGSVGLFTYLVRSNSSPSSNIDVSPGNSSYDQNATNTAVAGSNAATATRIENIADTNARATVQANATATAQANANANTAATASVATAQAKANATATARAQTDVQQQKANNIAAAQYALETFCSDLVNQNYPGAYSLLSTNTQGQTSEARFEEGFNNNGTVESCTHGTESSYASTRIVFPVHLIYNTSSNNSNQDIHATLILDGDGSWRIDQFTA